MKKHLKKKLIITEEKEHIQSSFVGYVKNSLKMTMKK